MRHNYYQLCLILFVYSKVTLPPQKLSPLNIKELYQYGANIDAYDDSPLVPFRAINATFSHKFTYFRQFFTKK